MTKKRKFGKKNVIKVDPLRYNVGLIGESGIGKTTLLKEVCEKLAGEDGYMILNMGKEDGVDAIAGAIYEDIPDFGTLEDFVDDVIDNREDYKELRVVIADTLDELFRITEIEVIRLHNKAHSDKPVSTINGAMGGFGKGGDKVIELILEQLWKLKSVGVNFWVAGHTKRKSVSDVATGEEYDTLTSNMTEKYFNAIKTKLHFLGVASIDRDIEKLKVKQKMGTDKVVGKVTGESRIITFRDDNYNIDSKSRFKEITPKINLDVEEFIKALSDAIEIEHKKQSGGVSIEESKVEQEKEKQLEVEQTINKIKSVDVDRNNKLLEIIKAKFPKATAEVKAQVKKLLSDNNISLSDVDTAKTSIFEEIVTLLVPNEDIDTLLTPNEE